MICFWLETHWLVLLSQPRPRPACREADKNTGHFSFNIGINFCINFDISFCINFGINFCINFYVNQAYSEADIFLVISVA